ncbi:hypothetical protein TNCV_1568531 [Trichonephila clavipes]|nr:hypothetical protein TNCV_1568531 [Trichonephila clavipes]
MRDREIETRLFCEEESISNSSHSEEESMEILKEKPVTLDEQSEKAIYSKTKVLYCSTKRKHQFEQNRETRNEVVRLNGKSIIKHYKTMASEDPPCRGADVESGEAEIPYNGAAWKFADFEIRSCNEDDTGAAPLLLVTTPPYQREVSRDLTCIGFLYMTGLLPVEPATRVCDHHH